MRIQLPAVIALLLAAVAGPVQAADRVVETTSGKENTHSGKIMRDDRDGVALRMSNGITPEFRREFVKRVDYECLSEHYAFGEGLFESGQYERALGSYVQAEKLPGNSEYAKQYIYRRIAQCHEKLSGAAHGEKAVEYWEKTRGAVAGGKGLFMRDAIEGLLRGYAKLGQWDKASKMLSELEGMGDSEKLMARLYQAQIDERRSRFSEAAEAFKKVAEGRNPDPGDETRALALAGYARCSVEAKNWSEALSAAARILAMADKAPDAALAVAFEVQGEGKIRTLLDEEPKALADDKAKTEKILDGITDMLHPVLQYKGSDWAEQRALYYVGILSEKLEKAGNGPEWQDRARLVYTELKTGYPDSKWASEAGERLKALGIR